ncbi:flagellar basal body-associated protein FliL [Desulfonatronum sp. SC1]|uniref:flagellar basal body-associated FliL family protein n=1 Tax=Desulfonatronum sp. SC1 TaxID=2109626 RepID=UPI000D31934D|nr:flagellar basal body-associated FliL family protein [Desulfonatronum sp. SC1]PTN32013.1 flagellar basal body protein FliL [Desulfonatronum sp. SC1]
MAKKEATPVEEDGKKGGKVKWVILLLVLLLLAGGGGAAYWFLMGPGAASEEDALGLEGDQADRQKPKAEFVPEIVTLEPFVVNLADPLGRRFLRMTLDVEVLNRAVIADVQRNNSRIRDAVILLLAGKSFADLASMEGKITLKNQIVERLNQIVGGGRVTNVYFTEFVVQ